jgi:Family of unknown function (DUF5670)
VNYIIYSAKGVINQASGNHTFVQSLINQLKKIIMSNILYIVAVVLVILWAFGYFSLHAGGIIHVLLVIAVIAILFRLIRGGRGI